MESLKDIYIDFGEDVTPGSYHPSSVYLKDEYGIDYVDNALVTNQRPNGLSISLKREITEPGTYTLYIKKGFVVATSNYKKSNPEINVTYTIEAPAEPLEYKSVSPAEGVVIENKIDVVKLEFDENIEVNQDVAPITFIGSDGHDYAAGAWCAVLDATPKTLKLLPNTDITADGKYILHIPAGVITSKDSGKKNKDIDIVYTIGDAAAAPLKYTSVTPAPGKVDKLETIELFYEVALDYNTNIPVTLTDADGNSYMDGAFCGVPRNNKEFMIMPEKTITAPGIYTLHIEKGKIFAADDSESVNEEITLVYIIEAPAAPLEYTSVEPVPGKVESLETILLNYNVELEEDLDKAATITDANGTSYGAWIGVPPLAGHEKEFKILLNDAITAPGTYTIHIEKGRISDANGNVNADIDLVYTIEAPKVPLEYTSVNPDPNVEQESLSSIQLGYDVDLTCINDNAATITDKDGNDCGERMSCSISFESKKVFYIGFKEITTPGEYTIHIAEGAIKDADGNVNDDIELVYTIAEPKPAEPLEYESVAFTPNEGEEFAKITFVFPEDVDYLGNPETNPEKVATITDAAGNGCFANAWKGVPRDNSKAFAISIPNPTAPGVYTIHIPAGAIVSESGKTNEEINYEFTVEAPLEYTSVNPAEGKVEKINQIKITFDENLSYNNDIKPTLTDADGKDLIETTWCGVTKSAPTEFVINNDADVTITSTPGTYTLHIPAGAITSESGKKNADITLVYTIEAPKEPLTLLSIDPEEGEVESIYVIELFYNKELVCLNDNAVTITNAADNSVAEAWWSGIPFDNNKAFQIMFSEVTTPGKYIVRIAKGAFSDKDGNVNDDIELVYTIAEPKPLSYTVSPEPGQVAAINDIDLTFEEDLDKEATNEAAATLTDAAGQDHATNWKGIRGSNAKIFAVTNLGIQAEGVYTLHIPAGAIVSESGKTNDEITLVYTIGDGNPTGVADVATDAACNISTLDGDVIVAADGDIEVALYALDGSLIGAAQGRDAIVLHAARRGLAIVRATVNGIVTVKKIEL